MNEFQQSTTDSVNTRNKHICNVLHSTESTSQWCLWTSGKAIGRTLMLSTTSIDSYTLMWRASPTTLSNWTLDAESWHRAPKSTGSVSVATLCAGICTFKMHLEASYFSDLSWLWLVCSVYLTTASNTRHTAGRHCLSIMNSNRCIRSSWVLAFIPTI